MNEIKRLQQLAGILSEIKVNNPHNPIINIGQSEYYTEEDVESFWVDGDIVLKYLLPLFPNDEELIIDYVENWNDNGLDEDDVEISLQDLKQDYLTYKENQ